MDFSVASYSFHRLLEVGEQDMFKYITISKKLGCTHLDPWNEHLEPLVKESKEFKSGRNALRESFSPGGLDYARRIREAIDEAGLPVVCLAIDGAHIWEESAPARDINRKAAYRWLEVAQILGAQNVRLDTGGTEEMPDEQFDIIVKGYKDVIAHAHERGIGVMMENHWGASHMPGNVVRILHAVPELNLLFDTINWAKGKQAKGWATCPQYAKSVHIKIRAFDEDGNDPTSNVQRVIRLLIEAGYNGVWGVECVAQGDEISNAKKSLDLVKRCLAELN